MNRKNLLVTTAVGLAFVVSGTAYAHSKHSPKASKRPSHVNFERAPFKRNLGQAFHGKSPRLIEKYMLEDWGTATGYLPGGFAKAGRGFKIPSCKTGCTVVTQNTLEVYNPSDWVTTGTTTGVGVWEDIPEQVAICPIIDGFFTNGSCFFSGNVTAADAYTNETNVTNMQVGTGYHSLMTYVYTIGPMWSGHWENDWHVYQ